jgi:hypothetical protein
MSLVITIAQLEDAINRARKQQPALDNVLQPDVNALAEIYGRMLDQKPDMRQQRLRRTSKWCDAYCIDGQLAALRCLADRHKVSASICQQSRCSNVQDYV